MTAANDYKVNFKDKIAPYLPMLFKPKYMRIYAVLGKNKYMIENNDVVDLSNADTTAIGAALELSEGDSILYSRKIGGRAIVSGFGIMKESRGNSKTHMVFNQASLKLFLRDVEETRQQKELAKEDSVKAPGMLVSVLKKIGVKNARGTL